MSTDGEGWSPPCLHNTDLFFVGEDKVKEIAKAKAICMKCARRKDCEAGAIRRDEQYGVWGGYSYSERLARAPFLEYQEPTIYASPRRTLDALQRQTYDVPLPPAYTVPLEIRILPVSEYSAAPQTSNYSPDTEAVVLQFAARKSLYPIDDHSQNLPDSSAAGQ